MAFSLSLNGKKEEHAHEHISKQKELLVLDMCACIEFVERKAQQHSSVESLSPAF